MKKILKRLLISTALITPIVVSTPLLLTSCSTNADVNKPVAETGPSIFKGPYGLELFEGKEQVKDYYLNSTIENNVTSNTIISEILKIVPNSPKFSVLASESVKKLTGFTNLKENTTLQLPSNQGWENGVNYSEFKLENLKLNETGKIEAIKNILIGFTFQHKNTKGEVLSQYPISAFDFETFKDKIACDVSFTVKESRTTDTPAGSNESIITNRAILSEIKFAFKLIDNSKWARLQSGDPIFISISWNQNDKAALFEGGFASNPKVTTTGSGEAQTKTIDFTGELNKSVFGNDVIDNTGKLNQWLAGKTIDSTSISDIVSPELLQSASNNLPNRFEIIKQNIKDTGLTNGNGSEQTDIKILKDKIYNSFIKGYTNQSETPTPPSNQLKASSTSTAILGKPNITSSVKKITKVGEDSDKKFTIELEFKLNSENQTSWYGLTGENSKLPIKFILTVETK